MAAFTENLGDRKERFSLLLLEPGEIYFEDFSAFYYPSGLTESEAIQSKRRGRLKICSKSILFDPSDVCYPILKFALKDVQLIDHWRPTPAFVRQNLDGKMLQLKCNQLVEMKEGNIIAPYVFNKLDTTYLFSLNYVAPADCIPQMCQLHRASTLPLGDQNVMISAIVVSRQSRVKFDTSWLENLYENIVLETQGDRITPLVMNPGRIMLTCSRLYFQPFNNVDPLPVLKIKLSSIKRITKRRFLLRQVGLEVDSPDNQSCPHLYLAFKNASHRDQLYDCLVGQPNLNLEETDQANMTLRWQNGVLSNYDYLCFLNSMADRSINDLTQYPVFPWVVKDYSSPTLDLTNPETFRDLSKPIGALNEERLNRLFERYRDMPEPKFLYGSHYSTPGYVLFYLVRAAPEYMLCLQNGRFDQADRMFNSVAEAWFNCTHGASDFKELVPEFYDSSGEFLLNSKLINFGNRQDGRPVGGVELPPWAKDSRDFVHKMREALECEYVSQNLHQWIDLIFGFKQRGVAAENAKNLFYYLTYEGAIDLENCEDPSERASLEIQIMEFGQTPRQLFTNPHPQRFSSPASQVTDEASIAPPSDQDTAKDAQIGLETSSEEGQGHPSDWSDVDKLEPFLEHSLHKEEVSDVKLSADGKNIFSVSHDSLLKMYSIEEQRQLRSINHSNMVLSSCVVLPDNGTVIIGCWDNNIYIYSIDYGRVLDTVLAHDDAVSSLSWCDGLLVSGSWDSTVKMWDCLCPNNGCGVRLSFVAELDHDNGVTCVDVSGDKMMIVTGTNDGCIHMWDTQSHYPVSQHNVHSGIVHGVSFSPDNQRVLSCGEDAYLKVLDVTTGTEVFSKESDQAIQCFCWDGKTVLGGGCHGDVLVWNMVTGQLVASIHGHSGPVTCISAMNNGQLVTGGKDNKVILWRSKT